MSGKWNHRIYAWRNYWAAFAWGVTHPLVFGTKRRTQFDAWWSKRRADTLADDFYKHLATQEDKEQ